MVFASSEYCSACVCRTVLIFYYVITLLSVCGCGDVSTNMCAVYSMQVFLVKGPRGYGFSVSTTTSPVMITYVEEGQ